MSSSVLFRLSNKRFGSKEEALRLNYRPNVAWHPIMIPIMVSFEYAAMLVFFAASSVFSFRLDCFQISIRSRTDLECISNAYMSAQRLIFRKLAHRVGTTATQEDHTYDPALRSLAPSLVSLRSLGTIYEVVSSFITGGNVVAAALFSLNVFSTKTFFCG